MLILIVLFLSFIDASDIGFTLFWIFQNESAVSCDANDEKNMNRCFCKASDGSEPEALERDKV